MADQKNGSYDEVDQLLWNAQLRDELEPFYDEANMGLFLRLDYDN